MSKSQKFTWFAWAIASVFYAYQYILRVMPSIMLEDITHQFHIDATVFGQFSGVYYIAYSLVHLPIGILLDRFGPRKIMTGCILLTVIGLLPIVYAEQWIYPILGRALIGIGSSAAILGTFKIIRMSFRESLFPRMLSLSVTIGLIGAIYGGEPVSYL
jgi:MFS family permease